MSNTNLHHKSSEGAEYARPPAFNPAVAVGFEGLVPSGPQPQFSASSGDVEAYLNDISNLPPPPSFEEAVAAPSAPPPSFELLFGQIQEARQTSDGVVEFGGKLCNAIGNTIGCCAACFLCIGLFGFVGIFIAMLVLGVDHYHECPAQPKISLMLIIGGAVVLALNVLKCLQCKTKKPPVNGDGTTEETPPKKKKSKLDSLFTLFFLIWLFLFSYWVYKAYKPSYNPRDEDFCHPVLYLFSFWFLNVTWAILLLICIC